HQSGGELVEVGLADDDGARALEARDAGRVCRWRIGEGGAGGGGRRPCDVDVVLDRDRHAVKRPIGDPPLAGALGSGPLGFGLRVRLRAQRDEDRGIVVRADARVGARDRGFGARRARTMRLDDRRYRLARHALRSLAVPRHLSKAYASSAGYLPTSVPRTRSAPSPATGSPRRGASRGPLAGEGWGGGARAPLSLVASPLPIPPP